MIVMLCFICTTIVFKSLILDITNYRVRIIDPVNFFNMINYLMLRLVCNNNNAVFYEYHNTV